MKRFDCPRCGKPLQFRLLPHVPTGTREFAFSCLHCGTVLAYNETALERRLWGTGWRRLFTLLGGMGLLSVISMTAGRPVALATLAAVAAGLAATHFLSPTPAYRILDRKPSVDGAQP